VLEKKEGCGIGQWTGDCTGQGMRLKNAVFLAFVGVVLVTILLVFGFVNDTLGVARGIIPPMRLPVSLIEAFAGVTSAIFLYVFYRDQH
jgi:predicted neutral ceramidase superfamily lipid hydrolase